MEIEQGAGVVRGIFVPHLSLVVVIPQLIPLHTVHELNEPRAAGSLALDPMLLQSQWLIIHQCVWDSVRG